MWRPKSKTCSDLQGGKREHLKLQSGTNQQSVKLHHLLPAQCTTNHKNSCTGSLQRSIKSKIFSLTVASSRHVNKEEWMKIKSRDLNSHELWNPNPQSSLKLFKELLSLKQVQSIPSHCCKPSKTPTLNSVCISMCVCVWKEAGSKEMNSTAWTSCFVINSAFKTLWSWPKRVVSFCCLFQ